MIRFGINTFLFASPFRTKDLPFLDQAKAMGFDLVEIPIEGEKDLDYVKAAEAYRRTGLRSSICAVMGARRDPSHPDTAVQKGAISYMKHCIDAAVTLGSPVVAGPLYAAVGRTWQSSASQRARDLARCAKNLKVVARYAEDHGVQLALEPLNRFETSFINLTDQAIELADMIGSPAVKLKMDTFHANENDRGTPGSGHVSWDEIGPALKQVGFDGALVIESFSTSVKQIARAAAVWRPLAASPEALARGGLSFLKKLMA